MSSHSDNQGSSSSPIDHRRDSDHNRSRSRSREKHRRRQDRDQYRNKGSTRKQKIVRVPEFTQQLVTFRAFLANQPDKISRQIAEKEYESYKSQWEQKNNQAFFKEHNSDAWFQEKYNPQVLDVIQRERKNRVIQAANKFIQAFKNGAYDEIDLSAKDPNSLGFICNDRDEEMDELKQISGNNAPSNIPANSQTIEINVSSSINISRAPFYGFDPDGNTLFIKAIPRTISRFDIYEYVGKLQGYETITLSEPVKKISFARYCWITFKDEECLKKAETAMNGLMIKNQLLVFSHSTSKQKRVKVLKKYPFGRIKTDAEVVKKLAAKLDEECGVVGNILLQAEFTSFNKQLDTILLYLRRVHAYDYYTSTSYADERSLCLKLGLSYLRVEADYEEVPQFPTIFKKMQNAAQNIIEKGLQIPDHMGQLRDDIQKSTLKIIAENDGVQLDKVMERQAWECFYCKKKFRSSQFLSKHIITKHPEIKDKHVLHIMELAYYADPNKLTSYSNSREERDNNKGRKPGFKRDRRREYRDLDEPEGPVLERTGSKPMVNFLDI